jgi:sugar/nucleoside kinase (ribokinase family)
VNDPPPTEPKPLLCLGEALVDLICERPVEDLAQAEAFVPHFGGVVANVALLAARSGARVALAGGVGADPWGRWLFERLADSGVDLAHFHLIEDMTTPLALVAVDEQGEPSYSIYGELPGTLTVALGDSVEAALAGAGALFLGSNTLVGAAEREVTMRARELALEAGLPVIFDPNLRLHRWRSRADASASANACVPRALLVRLNAAEARLLTGEDDLERAAVALLKAGARNVVITLGPDGAMLRGRFRADVAGVPARVISTVGAGDVFTATLLARLAATGWYEPAIAAGLRDAMRDGAAACERWGAVD